MKKLLYLLVSFPILLFAAEYHCDLIQVQSSAKIENENFVQVGAGWVITANNEYYILTPNHVVFGADKVEVRCGNSNLSHEVTLVGKSDSLDLALLKLKELPSDFVPMFNFDEIKSGARSLSPLDQGGSARSKVVALNNETGIYYLISSPEYHVEENFKKYGKGFYQKVIVVEVTAIRPGMSGSPVYDYTNLQMPIGMLIQTKINGDASIAIPLEEIVASLDKLLVGEDPWDKRPKIESKLIYDNEKSRVIKQRSLMLENGKKIIEACHKSSTVESSEWINVGLSGGDWGEGGDTKTSSGIFSGIPPSRDWGSEFSPVIYSIYKQTSYCDNEGLIIDGRNLLAIYEPSSKKTIKTDNLNSLLQLFIGEDKVDDVESYIKQYGVFADDTKLDYKSFCQEELLGKNLTMTHSSGTGGDTPLALGGWGTPWVHQKMSLKEDRVGKTWMGLGERDFFEGIICSKKRDEIHLQEAYYKTNGGRPTLFLWYDLKIKAKKVDGFIKFGHCTLEFKETEKDAYWNILFHHEQLFTVFLKINPNSENGPLVSFNLVSYQPDCLIENGATPPWLLQLEMFK